MKNIKTEIVFLIITAFAGLVGFAANTGLAKGNEREILSIQPPIQQYIHRLLWESGWPLNIREASPPPEK